MRRFALLVSVVGLVMALLAPTASAKAPYCGITWGSLTKTVPDLSEGPITNVRAGRHACFDRLVIDITGNTHPTGYTIGYVPEFTQDGSGEAIPLRGGASIQIGVNSKAHDEDYVSSVPWVSGDEPVNVNGFSTFRQVIFGGTYEGYTQFGLGVRARLPFRVFRLTSGPGQAASTRLVIDVAHRW